MKLNKVVAAAMAALLVGSSVPARAWEYTGNASGEVEKVQFGGKFGDIRQAKYEEYHNVPNGVVIDHFDFESSTGPYEIDFKSRWIGQPDQEYKLEGGKPGMFRWEAEWNQIVHNYSYNARSPWHQGDKNVLVLPSGVRGANVNNLAYQQTITNAVTNSPYLNLGIYLDEAKIGGMFKLAKDFTLSFEGLQRQRTGTKKLGATFGFTNTQELPQPVDTLTHELGADLDYTKKDFQARLHYEIQNFHNNVPDLTFDNPLNTVPTNAAASMGRLALDPDNQAQQVALSMGAELPAKTHVSAETSFTLFKQNMPLLPQSINPNSFTAGQITQGLDKLPISNADRQTNIYTGSVILSNRYFDNFRTSLAAKMFQEDSKSQVTVFNGYARYDTSFSAGPFETERPQQLREDVEWKADYDLTKIVSLSAGYNYEYLKQNREVARSDEQTFKGGVTIRPSTRFFTNISYLLGLRRAKSFDYGGFIGSNAWIESPGLVRFDTGDRNRNQGRVQVQYNAEDDTTYGASFRMTYDDFRAGKRQLDGHDNPVGVANVAQFKQYGLTSQRSNAFGLNVEKPLTQTVDVGAYGEFDYTRMELVSNQGAPFQDPGTDWDQQYRATSIIGGVNASYKPTHDWKFDTSYDVVSTVGHLDFFGANPHNSLNGGTALNSVPAVKRLTQTFGLKARYQIAKAWGLTARYQFWQYLVQDWQATNVPLVAPSGAQIYMGANQGDSRAHLVALGADYRF